jgi:hypothetical protein
MNNEEDRYIAKAHEKIATRNSQIAVKRVSELESTLHERLMALETRVANQDFEISHLHDKYNLLLTKNFNGGSTSGE